MGLILLVEGVLRSHLPPAPWRPLVTNFGYSVGFIVVIVASQQLFTENTLYPLVPLLHRRDGTTLRRMLMLWAVVLVANMVGALLFAWFAAATETFAPEYRHAFSELAKEAFIGNWLVTFLRAIVAGWIVALIVWMLPAAEQSRLAVIAILAWVIGAGKLAHVVAGAVKVFYLAFTGQEGFGQVTAQYIVPALLGNIVGGVGLVAMVNHAQVSAGEEERR